jgi:hypothetical protein
MATEISSPILNLLDSSPFARFAGPDGHSAGFESFDDTVDPIPDAFL